MRAIDRKVLRDARRMAGQLGAVALVLGCGLGLALGMSSTIRSLATARSDYYAQERFAHVFASLRRAPEHVASALHGLPGVQEVETRVVADVTLDVPGLLEAATGRLVSIPDKGEPSVNRFRLRGGRLPRPGHGAEVVASEAFWQAHDLPLGTVLGAVIDGRHQLLRVVGTGLSPEFTYATPPGSIVPDDRRFGVLWIRRGALGPALDMDGAFNDVALRLARDAPVEAVIERVDGLLERYGGVGAVARADQASAFFLENELDQLRTIGTMVPALFLVVTAFLLSIVLGRIVAAQREQIAAMRALGYRGREIGLHFAKLLGFVLAAGSVIGLALATWLGSAMTRLYAEYYRFPELSYRLEIADAVPAWIACATAASLGAVGAIRRALRLPPAEAMRPQAPARYEPTILERLGLAAFVPPAARMVLRELERRPLRAGMSCLGIAMATGLVIVSTFSYDAVRYMLFVGFGLTQREDVQLSLTEPRSLGALSSVRQLPGVLHAEPFRTVPVRLRAGHRWRDTALTGLFADARLHRPVDVSLNPVPIPPDGLVLNTKLAELLGVGVGDSVLVEVREGRRRVASVPVGRVSESFVGTQALAEIRVVARLLGEAPTLNGAWLLVDERRLPELHGEVKRTPAIAGVTARATALRQVRRLLDENVGTSVAFSLAFSLVMAFGVLYNAVRITLAERARELASLRVLGFRRREVGAILLGEIGLLVAVALPAGLLLGRAMAAALAASPGFDNEQFRLPFVVEPATYALATAAVLLAAAVSAVHAWRRLHAIPIVDVLKSRD